MQSTLVGQTVATTAQPSKLKKVLALLFSFIVGIVVITSALGSDTKSSSPSSPSSIPEYKRYPTPSAAEFGAFKATTSLAFEVKHVSTKKIEGKHRYFFTAKNLSDQDVPGGRVVVELYKKNGPVMFDRLESNNLVKGSAASLYVDARTSPDPFTMGSDNNVRTFKFAVYDGNGYLLATGEGEIPPTIIE